MADGQEKPNKAKRTKKPLLSVRDIKFCQLYALKGNAYQCYLEAGFEPAQTRNATDAAVLRLVRKRQIIEYIRHLQNVAAEAAEITVEEIAVGVLHAAKADRRKMFGKDGTLLPFEEWPQDVADCLEGVEIEELIEGDGEGGKQMRGYAKKVKTAARMPAWAKLMEWKRMLGADKNDENKPKSAPLVISGDANPDDL